MALLMLGSSASERVRAHRRTEIVIEAANPDIDALLRKMARETEP
jgi:hypothetical protein